MIKKIKKLFYLMLFFVFTIGTISFYLSDTNVKKTNKHRSIYLKQTKIYLKNLSYYLMSIMVQLVQCVRQIMVLLLP